MPTGEIAVPVQYETARHEQPLPPTPLGAANKDPIVEPSGIDRLSKHIDIVVRWGDTQLLYTAPHQASKDARYLFHLPNFRLRRTRVPAHQRGPHARGAAARSIAQRKINAVSAVVSRSEL
ncbi:hypothetical protein BGW80DRAFT_1466321 [Lactifluus volemus]|nr:hypothetical protein BGW80DRAFT_1466321 [Lactifluus volemus]